MNNGSNQPQNPGGGRNRRRRRRGGGHKGQHGGGGGSNQQPQGARPQPGNGGPGPQQRRNRQRRPAPTFVGPMDHSYRGQAEVNGNLATPRANRPGGYHQPSPFQDVENEIVPLPIPENAPPRIFAFIEDLFFLAKIQEISRKLNIKVQFVKTDKDLMQHVDESKETPTLIIFDLNNVAAKPLVAIPKLRKEFKKGTSIVGFVPHVQGDLKVKAQEAGCDVVMPRSAFSQNLAGLLRRHAAPELDAMSD